MEILEAEIQSLTDYALAARARLALLLSVVSIRLDRRTVEALEVVTGDLDDLVIQAQRIEHSLRED